MARATRIYVITDKDGKVVAARTVKYEMRWVVNKLKEQGNDLSDFNFWSVPDNDRYELRKVNDEFFQT